VDNLTPSYLELTRSIYFGQNCLSFINFMGICLTLHCSDHFSNKKCCLCNLYSGKGFINPLIVCVLNFWSIWWNVVALIVKVPKSSCFVYPLFCHNDCQFCEHLWSSDVFFSKNLKLLLILKKPIIIIIIIHFSIKEDAVLWSFLEVVFWRQF